MIEIAPRDLAHFVLRAHDDRELFGVVFLSPGPITDERGEEAGEAIGLVCADRFKMPTKGFGSHIDAVDRLRVGRTECADSRRQPVRPTGPRPSERAEQTVLIPGLKGLEPDWSMVGFGKASIQSTNCLRSVGDCPAVQSDRCPAHARARATAWLRHARATRSWRGTTSVL